jgi:hypothetical protein
VTSQSNFANRKRDLARVKLSPEARADVRRLRAIRRRIERHQGVQEALRAEQRDIWKRRNEAGDVWQSELARLSGVSQPFVAREIGK